MFRRIIVLAAVISLSSPGATYPQDLWTNKDGSIRNIDTRAILADGHKIYLATRNELYASDEPRGKWESIFFIPSGENEISCISGNSGNLLVGTKRGLFRSQDHGKTWRNVFRTIIPDKASILAIDMPARDADKIIIGTKGGLFISDDGGARWRDVGGALKGHGVKCITPDKGSIYVGADDGLYITKDGSYDWQKVLTHLNISDTGDVPEEASDTMESDEMADPGINCIALKGSRIYAATLGKILYSDDAAKSWKSFSCEGLTGYINSILVPERSDKLYCATTKGVFEYAPDKDRWSELYNGMGKVVSVKSIVFGSADEKTLWAGTDKGVYRLEIMSIPENQYIDVEKNLKTMKVLFDGEPAFKELQEAAIKFNDVSPDKVRRWHAESRMRSLVPKVNVGFDNSKSNTYEIYTSATKDYIIAGPDDISEGIDVSVSWDLANLIWSDDQTNIDVRSRLTTQLRNDILDDLRRAYFERKRLQYEMIASPPMEAKLRFEKELRIRELTQAIDDMTGNYLTARIGIDDAVK